MRPSSLYAALSCFVLMACGAPTQDPPSPSPRDDMGAGADLEQRDQRAPLTDQGAEMGPARDLGQPSDQGQDLGPQEDMTPTQDPRYAPGRWPAPTKTLTLGPATADGGLYVPDVQMKYPDVEWDKLERLYIPAGEYKFIRLGNLPKRSRDKPLIITNKGGQVRVGGQGHHYVFAIGGGSGWVLSGRHDPIAQMGDQAFRGHHDGDYSASRERYGIFIDDKFSKTGNSGLAIGSGATEFEVEFVEIARAEFAGALVKTDNTPDATMAHVSFHDNYIHDTGSEGVYFGSTQGGGQHKFTDLKFYNNRLVRTGTEAIQLGQLGQGCEIHHNVMHLGAIDWRAAFQLYQDNNAQIGVREGGVKIHHNLFIGGGSKLLFIGLAKVDGDTRKPDDEVLIEDNLFEGSRHFGVYVSPNNPEVARIVFRRNTFRGLRFEYDEVYKDATNYKGHIRIGNAQAGPEVLIEGNSWQGEDALIQGIAPDATRGKVTARQNTKRDQAPVRFVDACLPSDANPLDLELWTDVASLGDGSAVTYTQGDWVTQDGELYRADKAGSHTQLEPSKHPEVWTKLPLPQDDLRLEASSPWAPAGLLDLR